MDLYILFCLLIPFFTKSYLIPKVSLSVLGEMKESMIKYTCVQVGSGTIFELDDDDCDGDEGDDDYHFRNKGL
jgi:hypothetical protein